MKELFRYKRGKKKERKISIITEMLLQIEQYELKEVLILDPYFKPEFLSDVSSNENEDLYISFLHELILSGAEKIKILTLSNSKSNPTFAKALKIDLEKNFFYSVKIKNDNEVGNSEIEVRYYPKGAHALHDRWLLFKFNKNNIGFHIGTTLHDYSNKDITITKMNSSSIFFDRFTQLFDKGR